jgi:hypothetical protein
MENPKPVPAGRLRRISDIRIHARCDFSLQFGNEIRDGTTRGEFRNRYAACYQIPAGGWVDQINRQKSALVYRASALHGQKSTLNDVAQL